MKNLILALLTLCFSGSLYGGEKIDWNKMATEVIGHWKSYKMTPKADFPEGMKVPDFVVELTIKDDGTGMMKTTVEGKEIENTTLNYAISDGVMFMYGKAEVAPGVPRMYRWLREGPELLLEIVGGGPATLHMKRVEQAAAGDGDKPAN
jgi:hypothetical protein